MTLLIIFYYFFKILDKNKKEFAKKFQVRPDKVKNLDEIYFKVERNINTRQISIFDIKINKVEYKDKNNSKLKYNIKNSQELKSLMKRIITS